MADPVRENAEYLLGAAIHDALCGCRPGVESGLTVRELDTQRAAPVVLDRLTAAGYRLAGPGEVVVREIEPTAAHPDPTGQRTWNVPVPGSYWALTCVTSMGPIIPRIQLSGAANYTPDEADCLADALRSAAADARRRFATSPAEPTEHPAGEL